MSRNICGFLGNTAEYRDWLFIFINHAFFRRMKGKKFEGLGKDDGRVLRPVFFFLLYGTLLSRLVDETTANCENPPSQTGSPSVTF